MTTRIECDKGRRDYRGCRINARELSRHDILTCGRRGCDERKHYFVSHHYPDKTEAELEVISVYAAFSSTRAEREGLDPHDFLDEEPK